MNMIGQLVAHRALSERRNIVIELIGADAKPTLQLVEALKTIGYVPKGVAVTCEFEEAHRRNLARSGDNISAYYAEPFHHAWIIDACREQQVLRKVDQVSCMSSKPRPKDPVVQGLSSTETRAVPRSYLDIEPYEDDGEGCSGDGSQGGETYLKNRSALAAMPVNNFQSSSSRRKHPG